MDILVWWKLTCPQTEPQTANVVVVQSVMIPHCDFHTGLSQVLWPKAVIHHGVIEHRVCCPLHHPRLLSAFPAGVRQYGAAAEENDGKMHRLIWTDMIRSDPGNTLVLKDTISQRGR